MKLDLGLGLEIDHRTGELIAAYLQIRRGKSAEVREFENGNVFADYDHAGHLLGIEILGPCRVAVLTRLARDEPQPVRKFLRASVPVSMVAA